jgi:hypothetical protein
VDLRTTLRAWPWANGKRERQPTMWVATAEFPTAASHPFYTRLNQLLCQHGFDDFAEVQCARFYATRWVGRACRRGSIFGCY